MQILAPSPVCQPGEHAPGRAARAAPGRRSPRQARRTRWAPGAARPARAASAPPLARRPPPPARRARCAARGAPPTSAGCATSSARARPPARLRTGRSPGAADTHDSNHEHACGAYLTVCKLQTPYSQLGLIPAQSSEQPSAHCEQHATTDSRSTARAHP